MRESCPWDLFVGSPPPGFAAAEAPARLSSAPRGGVPARRWLSTRWVTFWVRPAELSPGVERSVGALLCRCVNTAGEVASPAAGFVVLCLYAFAQRVNGEF